MKKTSTSERLDRLDWISARLKADDALTVAGLASELGISRRTLTRDIQLLRDQGLPIEADRGRGGGIRLHRSWGIGRVKFSYSEAIDLLVSLAVAEQMKSPFFMAELGPIRRKLLASLAPKLKHEITGLKSRILIGETASQFMLSEFSQPPQSVVEKLHQGFVNRRSLDVSYRARQGELTQRVIEPHYLLLHSPVWYVLAFDHLRSANRMFRCDRIENAALLKHGFKLLPRDRFEKTLRNLDLIAP